MLDEYTAPAPTVVIPENPDILGTAPLAESTLVYANKYGKDAAIAEFNNPNGAFSKEGYEIFAYDINGTVLAMPSDPQLIGENRINYRDSYGMRTVHSFMNRCLKGGGYVHYYETVP